MNLLLVCGGQSTEHAVSRMSCVNIYKNADKTKYDIKVAGITKEGEWYDLASTDFSSDNWLEGATKITDHFTFLKSFDVVFPVLHGQFGEDGTIQGLLEMAQVPYVGCRVMASCTAMDKIYAKKLFDQANIPQVPSLYVKKRYDDKLVVVDDEGRESFNVEMEIYTHLGFPCFVKASRSGSSVGCYKVNSLTELLPRLHEAASYDRHVVVEKAINATELECAVIGNDDISASRVGQILPHGEFYTYESKYEDEQSATCIPARVDQSIQDYIRQAAVKAFKAVDGTGLARCDFFYDNDTGNVYLNEINTMPGFTNISMYPQLMKDAGLDTPALIDELIKLALQR